jgi:hypothetical protein
MTAAATSPVIGGVFLVALEWVPSETGVRTLRDEFDKVVRHNQDHVKQIKIALDRQTARQM